jgi:hypothetical protein
MALISSHVRTIEVADLEMRVTALEDREESDESLHAPANLDEMPECQRRAVEVAYERRKRMSRR